MVYGIYRQVPTALPERERKIAEYVLRESELAGSVPFDAIARDLLGVAVETKKDLRVAFSTLYGCGFLRGSYETTYSIAAEAGNVSAEPYAEGPALRFVREHAERRGGVTAGGVFDNLNARGTRIHNESGIPYGRLDAALRSLERKKLLKARKYVEAWETVRALPGGEISI